MRTTVKHIKASEYERAFRTLLAENKWQRAFELLEAAYHRMIFTLASYTRQELADDVGIEGGWRAVNLLFGKFARAVGELCGYKKAPKYFGRPYWMLVLEEEPIGRGYLDHTTFELLPEVMIGLSSARADDDT